MSKVSRKIEKALIELCRQQQCQIAENQTGIQKFEIGEYVAFVNLFAVMAGKISNVKESAHNFKYEIKALDATNMISTYEVLERDVYSLDFLHPSDSKE